MEIELFCDNCKQSVCTCNVRCPGCGSLLNKVNKYIGITLRAEIGTNGKILSVSDEAEYKMIDEVLSFVKKVKQNKLNDLCSYSGMNSNVNIIFNFTNVKSEK